MAKKQAVVLIHGIGEQVPMETLRKFVDAVWVSDSSLRPPKVPETAWSKPDDISGNFELRRLTTAENHKGQRTDFFEFYWAHLMEGTELGHVRAWLKVLLFRSPSRVLPQFRGIWWTIVASVIGAIAVALWHFAISPIPAIALKVGGILWFLFGSTLIWFLVHFAGDAARYLHVAPPNIKSRHQIREAGIDLLEKLHASQKYDRIILVGHSLGSVIGFDILTHLWTRCHDKHRPNSEMPGHKALEAIELFVRNHYYGPIDVAKYQELQSDLLKEINAQRSPWLISDFVTLGSPLAHAPMLLARCEEEFYRKTSHREFPTCPPAFEEVEGTKRFSFPIQENSWVPHHAAVFAVTRWTNLYFPCRNTIWGDVIGGPIAPVFGFGVQDVAVETDLNNGFFTHTHYWTLPENQEIPEHIEKLRRAVRIV